ncbi:phage tail protein I [Tianweitania sediminis]|uniref:Phage tail protein I n=1 Tax=Tianweitania sediminis TaxID=1502156 RepID=A0A8J7RPA4_9HYPH|nr:phage tail protein I [Tianweitania sediminis]MBP0440691.1 phage tail protein I [Tianweitania sediminis]
MTTEPLFSNQIWLTDEDGNPVNFGSPYGPATLVPDILPSNSGPFERALALGLSDDLAVPFAEILDPATTPARFKPQLAAHESVDLWYDDWSDDRQRAMIAEAPALAKIKGTHEAAVRFLGYVDAEVIDRRAYPARFVLGLSSPTFTPLNHPAFKARYLVKVHLKKPLNAFVLGRSALAQGALRTVDLEPIRRAKFALQVSKAPETEYLVTFAWRRPATFGDAIPLGDDLPFGGYVDRTTL